MGFDVADDRRRQVGYGGYDEMMDCLEISVTGRDYVGGNRFSAADVHVGCHIGWGLQFGTIESRPAFAAYAARVRVRPAFRRALAIDEALSSEPPKT